MKGNQSVLSINVTDKSSGAVAGRIERYVQDPTMKKVMKEALPGRQNYRVTVAPGVDPALMVAMCIYIDEINEQPRTR
jgi:hypothetical protein